MILVTGAGGFIGRHLVEHFKSIGLNVVPLYHGSEVKILHNEWEADLSRIEHIQKLREVAQIPHTIIHLAGHIDISLKTNPASPLMPPIPGKKIFQNCIFPMFWLRQISLITVCIKASSV